MEVSLTWRFNLYCCARQQMFLLYRGVRYCECPLRKVPIPYVFHYNINLVIDTCMNYCVGKAHASPFSLLS